MKYLLLLTTFLTIPFCYADEQPDIIIQKKFRNLGDVKAGTILKERYYLVNNTNHIIHILKVNPECSCTNYNVSSYEIMPKDSIYIELVLDTTHKLGSQTVYTMVKTDSKTAMYRLALKANIHSTKQ